MCTFAKGFCEVVEQSSFGKDCLAKFFVFSVESIGVLKDRSEACSNGVELPCEGSFLRNDLFLAEMKPFRGGFDFGEYDGRGWLDAIDERGSESSIRSSRPVASFLAQMMREGAALGTTNVQSAHWHNRSWLREKGR